MLRAAAFMLLNLVCCGAALAVGPLWALVAYALVYFNPPADNYWGAYLPDLRWSLLMSAVVAVSALIHRDRLAPGRMRPVYLTLAFLALTLLITLGWAVDPANAADSTYNIFCYLIIVFLLVKSLRALDDLRRFNLVVIGLAALLSLQAVFEGKRTHARLENIGPLDAGSSNEFGMLLAAIVPLILPFVLKGKWYERAVGVGALVLCINGIVLCNSRGATISLAAAGVYGVIAAGRRMRLLLVVACLAGAAATLFLADEYFLGRISTLWNTEVQTEEQANDLSTGRVAIFRYGLNMARDYPHGAGPEGFRALSRFYMPAEILSPRRGAPPAKAAHNSYLQVLVEQGIPGLALFLWICMGAVLSLLKANRALPAADPGAGFLNLTLLSLGMSLVASLAGGMFGAQVYYEFLWWQVALAAVGASIALDRSREQNPSPDVPLAQESGCH